MIGLAELGSASSLAVAGALLVSGAAQTVDHTIVVALIAAVPGTLAVIVAWDGRREAKAAKVEAIAAKDASTDLHDKMVRVELSVDGFMTKYSMKSDEAARLLGVAQERQKGSETAAAVEVAHAVVTAEKAATDQAAAELRSPVSNDSGDKSG